MQKRISKERPAALITPLLARYTRFGNSARMGAFWLTLLRAIMPVYLTGPQRKPEARHFPLD
jgi:hypothetical protein